MQGVSQQQQQHPFYQPYAAYPSGGGAAGSMHATQLHSVPNVPRSATWPDNSGHGEAMYGWDDPGEAPLQFRRGPTADFWNARQAAHVRFEPYACGIFYAGAGALFALVRILHVVHKGSLACAVSVYCSYATTVSVHTGHAGSAMLSNLRHAVAGFTDWRLGFSCM